MSTAERVKILDYLPPEQKQKVLMLVQRLKEQSDAKEKYASLYQSSQSALDALTLKYNKLKDENDYLKQQIHNSFSIVSQVRANFRANKQKLAGQRGTEEEEWEDASEEEGEENRQGQANNTTLLSHKPPRPNNKSPLQKYRPPMTSGKKVGNVLNISGADLNHTNLSGSKGKEIEDLRREVRALQEDKRRKEGKQKDVKEKYRLVDEIKNRYKGGEETRPEQVSHCKESTIQRIDITDAFDNQDQESYLQRSKEKFARVRSSEKAQTKKQGSFRQKVQPKVAQQSKNKPQTSNKGLQSQLVTSNDYSDVLQMINSYNL